MSGQRTSGSPSSAPPGLVGETMIQVLEERDFPVSELYPLASNRSLGKTRALQAARTIPCDDLATFDFSKADIGLFSAGAEVSREFAPKAAAAGCIVIDNTSEFRYQDDIPLVVPEVNPHAIAQYKKRGIIANPNCSTIQMLVALKPIHDAVGIERINVATYQSVSGAGREAVEELATQTAALLNGQGPVQAEDHPEADRLQRRAADRRVPGQRLHEGRDEDGVGDPQDHGGPHHPREPDRSAGAGVLRPFRGGAHRDPEEDHRCRSARAAEKSAGRQRCWTSASPAGTPPRLPRQRTATQFMSGEYVKIFRLIVDLIYGSWRTTCARAPPPTACRSRRFWYASIFKLYCRPNLRGLAECDPRVCF